MNHKFPGSTFRTMNEISISYRVPLRGESNFIVISLEHSRRHVTIEFDSFPSGSYFVLEISFALRTSLVGRSYSTDTRRSRNIVGKYFFVDISRFCSENGYECGTRFYLKFTWPLCASRTFTLSSPFRRWQCICPRTIRVLTCFFRNHLRQYQRNTGRRVISH